MIRRWLIRSLSLLLCAVCMATWAVSYWRRIIIAHTPDGRNGVICSVEHGTAIVSSPVQRGGAFDVRLWMGRGRLMDAYLEMGENSEPFVFLRWYCSCQWHIAGFAAGWGWQIADDGWMVMIPMWFITGVSAGLLGWVWWKTGGRRGRRTAGAFPVEVGTAGAERLGRD